MLEITQELKREHAVGILVQIGNIIIARFCPKKKKKKRRKKKEEKKKKDAEHCLMAVWRDRLLFLLLSLSTRSRILTSDQFVKKISAPYFSF